VVGDNANHVLQVSTVQTTVSQELQEWFKRVTVAVMKLVELEVDRQDHSPDLNRTVGIQTNVPLLVWVVVVVILTSLAVAALVVVLTVVVVVGVALVLADLLKFHTNNILGE
jgi:Flp pilus assembly protein TadB